jgi:hypothetical protein
MKQTAVEWLEEIIYDDKEFSLSEVFKQVKEMEKEQIVTTWNTAHQAGRFEGKGIAEDNWQTFESHWEETFKSE